MMSAELFSMASNISWGSCKEHTAWISVRPCALVRPHSLGRKLSPHFDLAKAEGPVPVSLCRSLPHRDGGGTAPLCAGGHLLCL